MGRTKCFDDVNSCPAFVDHCKDATYEAYMEKHCSQSCRLCGGEIAKKECTTSADCGKNAFCEVGQYKCKCNKYYGGDAKKGCKRTKCFDSTDSCPGLVDYCKDATYEAYMEEHCSQTCALCGGEIAKKECSTAGDCAKNAYCDRKSYTCKCNENYRGDGKKKCKRTVCKDTANCGPLAGFCKDATYEAYMESSCSGTCKLCD